MTASPGRYEAEGAIDARDIDIPRFSFASYLSDHVFALLAFAVSMLGLGCMLPVLGIGVQGTLLVTLFVAFCEVAALVFDYMRKRSYYREMRRLIEQLDRAIGLDTIIDEPSFLEGRIGYGTISELSKLAAADISDMRADDDAYRRYIELWIHEIKTPIAAIKLMLADRSDARTAKISREIERVESQVDQALYYARSTSVANDYAIREVDLTEAIREACKRNARFMIEHGTAPVFELEDGLTVLTDESWLVFMLGQVVVNASKYGASSVTFSAKILDEGTTSGRTVLEVIDDGCGIPATDVRRVFDRGFTGVVGREHGSATGMGLYLVARLCGSLGLHVGLASEEGVGTRVIFTFPHDRARKQAYL